MKVEEKRRLKKIAIMEAALDAWSVDDYRTTSLSCLAESLNMTKQALYRYFKNKEDLLDSMSEYVGSLETEWFRMITEKLHQIPAANRLRFFIESLSKGLISGTRYARFDSYNTLRLDKLSQRHSLAQIEGIREILELPDRVLHLIMMFSFFFWGWNETRHIQKKRTNREKVDLILEIIEKGLATEIFTLPAGGDLENFNSGEYAALRKNLDQNKLILAVNQVIQEKGFQGVTLELIAEKAGISKSTLYNYFKNKDEMLTQTTNILVKEYMQYHSQLLSRRETFEQKLMVHLEMQYLMFPRKPQAFIILKQFMSPEVFSRVERPAFYPGFLDFLQDGLNEKKLKPALSVYEYQMVFSFFIFIERVIYKNEEESPHSRVIINWLKLLAYGYRKEETA